MNGYNYDINDSSFNSLWGPQAQPLQAPTPAPVNNTPTENNGTNFSEMANIQGYYDAGAGYINDAYSNYMNQMPGLMQQAQGSVQNYTPQIQQAYQQSQGQLPGFMQQAQQNINTAYTDAQNYLPHMYQGQVQPMMQQAIDSMAGRNMVNSSVGADALGNAMSTANQQLLGAQAALGGQQAGMLGQLAGTGYQSQAALAQAQANAIANGYGNQQSIQGNMANNMFNSQSGLMSQYMGLMGGLGSQYAQQASALHGHEYDLLANMLPTLINNSLPGEELNPDGTPVD